MVKRVTYINKTTREISPTLEQWIENIVHPLDRKDAKDVYDAEVQRSENSSTGIPDRAYIMMFERYFSESNIEIILTE
jgi:hypothetical protein